MASAAEIPISDANDSPHDAHPAANTEMIPVPNMIRRFPLLLSILNLLITSVIFIPNRTPIRIRSIISRLDVAENVPIIIIKEI